MAKVEVRNSYLHANVTTSINYLISLGVHENWRIQHCLKKNANRIALANADFVDSLKIIQESFFTETYKDENGSEGKRVPEDKVKEFQDAINEIDEKIEFDFYELDIEHLMDVNPDIKTEKIADIMGIILIDKEEASIAKKLKARTEEKEKETSKKKEEGELTAV